MIKLQENHIPFKRVSPGKITRGITNFNRILFETFQVNSGPGTDRTLYNPRRGHSLYSRNSITNKFVHSAIHRTLLSKTI